MTQIIRFELTILNNDKYDSCVTLEGDRNGYGDNILYHADSFEEGLRSALLQTFDDMWNDIGIHRLKCGGWILPIKKEPAASLSDVISLDTKNMEILTARGYMTFSFFEEKMDNISHALMLLVWKWSRHFSGQDEYRQYRKCVICGKTQCGKQTGYSLGRERYTFPHSHCFNPKCFSHEIERMIDPAYVFTPPKPGDDFESTVENLLQNTDGGEKIHK